MSGTPHIDMLRSPLGRARGLGSARAGSHHWWAQRLTALALVPLTLWFIFSIIHLAGASHQVVIDWLSRPPEAGALSGKPAAIMGASPGMTGTARGQSQLRQAFVFTNTYAMTQPEVLVARAHEKFDQAGTLIDQATRGLLAKYLEAFSGWVARFATP